MADQDGNSIESMRLVMIEWWDSYGCSTDWENLEDASKAMPATIKSVGWLAFDGVDCKVVVPHISQKHKNCHQQGCGDMTIPTICVRKIVDLHQETTTS